MKSPPSTKRLHHPLWHLVAARLLEFVREPAAIFWVYGFPLLMMIALGVAFRNQPVEQIRIDIQQDTDSGAGNSSSSTAKAVRDALAADRRFLPSIHDEPTSRRRLRTGRTDLVVIPSRLGDRYEYLFDPTKPGSALARNTVNDALQCAAGRTDPVTTSDTKFDEPGGRYIDFLVPGLLGMGLMGGGLWGVGFAIVDMRIRKLLKRFLATPMKRTHFLMAMMVSRFVFMVPEVLLLLLVAWLLFGVVIHGSLLLVVLLVVLGALQFAGIGLLVASRAQTLETVSGLMNLVMLPMWIASGIFFSSERFPEIVQPLIRLLPLTPLIDALRAVILEGATVTAIGWQLGAMVLWGVVTFGLALWWFRWN